MMEIKIDERETKACYISRVMLCIGFVWQEITSLLIAFGKVCKSE